MMLTCSLQELIELPANIGAQLPPEVRQLRIVGDTIVADVNLPAVLGQGPMAQLAQAVLGNVSLVARPTVRDETTLLLTMQMQPAQANTAKSLAQVAQSFETTIRDAGLAEHVRVQFAGVEVLLTVHVPGLLARWLPAVRVSRVTIAEGVLRLDGTVQHTDR